MRPNFGKHDGMQLVKEKPLRQLVCNKRNYFHRFGLKDYKLENKKQKKTKKTTTTLEVIPCNEMHQVRRLAGNGRERLDHTLTRSIMVTINKPATLRWPQAANQIRLK